MKQIVNEVYKPLFTTDKRFIILMGGRGAGRSTVASQYANARLVAPEYFRCAIMRYILGDIRNSIYREITDRAEENGILNALSINDSTMTIEYGANTINAVGFKKSSGDQKAKLKSLANYNCVIIEEADEVPEEDFMQLDDSLRTLKGDIKIILLLNPPAKNHWIIKRWFNLQPSGIKDFYIPELKPEITDTLFIRTSYKDNQKNIAPQSIMSYENYRLSKPSHYYNMIVGLVPEVVRGKIYNNWRIVDGVPFEARLVRRGLDFGYSVDPTAIVDVYKYNDGYIIDEQLYKKGMSNKDIADFLNNLQNSECIVIADSAEPKSIDEIKLYGVNILPAVKGQGSISTGIQFVQAQRISVTKRSVNIIKEYDEYAWLEDKDGKTLPEPKPVQDHCFIGSSQVTTIEGQKPIKDIQVGEKVLTSSGYKPVVIKHNNGIKEVSRYSLQFDTTTVRLECTSDHKIKTGENTWTPISQLKPGMTVYSIKSLEAKNTICIKERDTFQRQIKECISRCGNTLMVKYQKVFTFIIKMGTPTIIKWIISLYYQLANIYQHTLKKGLRTIKALLWSSKEKDKNQQKNGTDQKLVRNGIHNTESTLGLTGNTGNSFANNAETTSFQDTGELSNFVITTAKLVRFEREESWQEKVYDITVEDKHEYFVNGILVHNCMDAIRYAMNSILVPDSYNTVAQVTLHEV